jgi:hypothetical protein
MSLGDSLSGYKRYTHARSNKVSEYKGGFVCKDCFFPPFQMGDLAQDCCCCEQRLE